VQLAQNYGGPAPAPGTFAGAGFDQAVQAAFAEAVPEPGALTSIAWVALGACLGRRRRGAAGRGVGHAA
jgi:hypothetical protein